MTRGGWRRRSWAISSGAIQRDDAAAVEAALGREAKLLDVTVNGGWAPLHAAAQVGAEKPLRVLLAAGADREARFQGKTPLGIALVARKSALAKVLIEAKVRIDDVDREGPTALHLAAQKGLVDVVGYLLDSGMNINERSHNRWGVTALQDAASEGQVETVRLLLDRGAESEHRRHPRRDGAGRCPRQCGNRRAAQAARRPP